MASPVPSAPVAKAAVPSAAQALVISLPDAAARREMQTRQMARLGIGFVFLDAVAPAAIAPGEMTLRRHGWARPLRETEVACLLSHRRAWQAVAAGTAPRLIVEDDAVLADGAKALVATLSATVRADYVTLETFTRPKLLSRRPRPVPGGPYSLSRLYHDHGGAAAYLLWPQGARKLLRFTDGFSPLADAALNIAPGIRRFQVEPAAAIQAMFLAEEDAGLKVSGVSSVKRLKFDTFGQALRGRLIRARVSLALLLRGIVALPVAVQRTVPFLRRP